MSPIRLISDIADLDLAAISAITDDSRVVTKGALFAALAGGHHDGEDYIGDALAKGAAFVLAKSTSKVPQDSDVTVLKSQNPRRDFALITAAYYKDQPQTVVAVGGTNGKSSTVHFLRQLWETLGQKAASLGTLGVQGEISTQMLGASMTTPDPVSLHKVLAALAHEGVTHLAMEASSHGLDQHRLDGVRISIGAFTSFSRDHMDYHESEDRYFAAKARQFSHVMPSGSVAVLNADIPEYAKLEEICKQAGHRIISYGKTGQGIRLVSVQPQAAAQRIKIKVMDETHEIALPLVGQFQAMNALCALGCAIAEDPENAPRTEKLVQALSKLTAVAGRMQRIGERDEKVVYVDYAHTPGALETVLKALRPHTKGKLVCVFGCGGDRDSGKRPIMGEISARLADQTIITDDNPRNEDPQRIRAQIMSAACAVSDQVQEIANRREAIHTAVAQIGSGDVLLVAGKGHEQGQIIGGHVEPFDDAVEVNKAISHHISSVIME